MDLEELHACIGSARREAERQAALFHDAAGRPGAGHDDTLRSERARLIIEKAKETARSLPADVLERRIQTVQRWREGRAAVAVAEANALMRNGRAADLATALEIATTTALAGVDPHDDQIRVWSAEHALEAWLDAAEKLRGLRRPTR